MRVTSPLDQQLNKKQWLAIVMLMAGVVIVQMPSKAPDPEDAGAAPPVQGNQFIGQSTTQCY